MTFPLSCFADNPETHVLTLPLSSRGGSPYKLPSIDSPVFDLSSHIQSVSYVWARLLMLIAQTEPILPPDVVMEARSSSSFANISLSDGIEESRSIDPFV